MRRARRLKRIRRRRAAPGLRHLFQFRLSATGSAYKFRRGDEVLPDDAEATITDMLPGLLMPARMPRRPTGYPGYRHGDNAR